MSLLLKEWQDLFLGYAYGFVGDHVDKIIDTHLLAPGIEPVTDLILDDLGHPYKSQKSAIAQNEFLLSNIELGVSDKTGRRGPAAHNTGQGGELHAGGGYRPHNHGRRS